MNDLYNNVQIHIKMQRNVSFVVCVKVGAVMGLEVLIRHENAWGTYHSPPRARYLSMAAQPLLNYHH